MREKKNKNDTQKTVKNNKKNSKELEEEIEEVISEKKDRTASVDKNNKNIEIDSEKLDIIEEEIKDNKEKFKNKKIKSETLDNFKDNPRYKLMFKNALIVIFYIVYFCLLILGKDRIPTIEFIRDLRIIILLDVIVSIILLEISLKKDSGDIFMYGIEMIFIGGFTLFILEYYLRQDINLNIWVSIIIGIIVLYYIIKCLVLSKKKKANN